MTTETHLIEQRFETAEPNEPVAWIHVGETPLGSPVLAVAIGQIGTEGASYTLSAPGSSGAYYYLEDQHGFRDVAAFGIVGPEGDNEVIIRASAQESSHNLVIGADFNYLRDEAQPVVARGSWYQGEQAILEGLKAQLSEHDMAWLYTQAYYILCYTAPDYQLLADPTMGPTTHTELMRHSHIESALREIIDLDERMRQNLTVFGSVRASDIPDVFIYQREQVHRLEKSIGMHLGSALLGQYIPTAGFRPNGRTWPYMDATQTDSNAAYGNELRGLFNGSISPAYDELGRESTETAKRLERSQKIITKLRALNQKEHR